MGKNKKPIFQDEFENLKEEIDQGLTKMQFVFHQFFMMLDEAVDEVEFKKQPKTYNLGDKISVMPDDDNREIICLIIADSEMENITLLRLDTKSIGLGFPPICARPENIGIIKESEINQLMPPNYTWKPYNENKPLHQIYITGGYEIGSEKDKFINFLEELIKDPLSPHLKVYPKINKALKWLRMSPASSVEINIYDGE